MKHTLLIDRFEQNQVVLKTNDNKTIVWPKNKLPHDIKEGEVLIFNINTNVEVKNDKKELAKSILNEILNTDL